MVPFLQELDASESFKPSRILLSMPPACCTNTLQPLPPVKAPLAMATLAPLDPKAFSRCWPHAPGPRESCLEPRDFADNAICFQENPPGNTTAFLSDARKIQSSFAAEPPFSQAGGAAPVFAAWLGSHCWKRVRETRAEVSLK